MKKWFSIVCPVCGWRHLPRKFSQNPEPITYPVQVVAGGGRARGFKVVRYLPYAMLPTLRQTEVWTSILCLYDRLAASYDSYFEVLGFLSPKMKLLLQELRPYENPYMIETSHYCAVYSQPSPDIIAPYRVTSDYSQAY